ncbi:MAG: hypothetical protein FWD29_09345 [Micrococcales bacterium]|nr:hypothetical protein [Micrococcales bacterium]
MGRKIAWVRAGGLAVAASLVCTLLATGCQGSQKEPEPEDQAATVAATPTPEPATTTPEPATPTPEPAPTDTMGSIPEEFVGQWAGSAGDISLSFTIEAGGTGQYSFEQGGYSESYSFMLEAQTETFSVQIPQNNTLGITQIQGTYEYSNGTLTLHVQTTFKNGRVFEYTVPCKRTDL